MVGNLILWTFAADQSTLRIATQRGEGREGAERRSWALDRVFHVLQVRIGFSHHGPFFFARH